MISLAYCMLSTMIRLRPSSLIGLLGYTFIQRKDRSNICYGLHVLLPLPAAAVEYVGRQRFSNTRTAPRARCRSPHQHDRWFSNNLSMVPRIDPSRQLLTTLTFRIVCLFIHLKKSLFGGEFGVSVSEFCPVSYKLSCVTEGPDGSSPHAQGSVTGVSVASELGSGWDIRARLGRFRFIRYDLNSVGSLFVVIYEEEISFFLLILM